MPGPSHIGNYNSTAPFDPCGVVPGWTGSGASSPDARPGRTEGVEGVFRDVCDYAASEVEYAGATAGRGCGRAGVTEVWGEGRGEVRMEGDWDFSSCEGGAIVFRLLACAWGSGCVWWENWFDGAKDAQDGCRVGCL